MVSNMNLTARQQQILDLIENHIDTTGFPPTRANIAEEFGFKSANAAEEHLKALAKKGAIEIIPGASRGIRLLNEKPKGIPIIGRVAAGNPILAEENIEDYCEIAPNFFRPRADFFLQVVGDSMKDIGILNDDWLAVHKTTSVNNGDIVVARINDEVTVKRFSKTKDKHLIHLEPENNNYKTIKIDLRQDEFNIEGLSVGILRR